jgi:hypothetical protein
MDNRLAPIVGVLRKPVGVHERDVLAAHALQNFPGIVPPDRRVFVIPMTIERLLHNVTAISTALPTIGVNRLVLLHDEILPDADAARIFRIRPPDAVPGAVDWFDLAGSSVHHRKRRQLPAWVASLPRPARAGDRWTSCSIPSLLDRLRLSQPP